MRVKGGKRGKLSSGDHANSYRDGNELGGEKNRFIIIQQPKALIFTNYALRRY